jgi:hypothetical protein
MESNTVMDIQIDQKVLMRMVERIVKMEHENLKTNKFSSSEMIEKIRKLIEFEVNKNDD